MNWQTFWPSCFCFDFSIFKKTSMDWFQIETSMLFLLIKKWKSNLKLLHRCKTNIWNIHWHVKQVTENLSTIKHSGILKWMAAEAYSEPRQTPEMERFENFPKKLHHRCLTGFWIRLWIEGIFFCVGILWKVWFTDKSLSLNIIHHVITWDYLSCYSSNN